MDFATLIGMIGVFTTILLGIFFTSGDFSIFFSISSFLIIVGGVGFVTLSSNSFQDIRSLFFVVRVVLKRNQINPIQNILVLLSFSEKARREGLLALEDDLYDIQDHFLRTGIQLVVDGTEPELVKSIMIGELTSLSSRHSSMVKIVDDIAAICPSFGMIGTLIGLVTMMKFIGGDPSSIGRGMGHALLTTLYGAILASGLFTPISNKLLKYNREEINMKEVVIEGVLSIQSGENPRILQKKVSSYFSPGLRKQIEEAIGD